MSTTSSKVWIALLLLVVTAAPGETLYERDGVVLEGTVRIANREDAVCQVLAANESPESYERMKANHGQPLHVWRLDFAVRNRSGRRLEQLKAHFSIASEWPPCTTWSGPQSRYDRPVQWASSFETLQQAAGMEPGGEVADTVYMLAFHDQQPRFESWQVDFRFAADSPAAPAGTGSAVRESSVGTGQLPPAVQVDLHLRKAEQALRDGDAATARTAMERLDTLQAEHRLEPDSEDRYRQAQAWASAGEPERAVAAAVRYLQAGGRDAEHYEEALDLINREGSPEPAPAGGPADGSPAAEAPRPGESREFDGMEFVWIPAGEFLMGSTSSEATDDQRPVTRVRISRGYWLGKYEVTQGQWEAVMGSNPSFFDECGPDCPVEHVSWEDAQAFLRQLNGRTGGSRYRLPTEAEWEYAARAGTTGDRYGTLDAIAWYTDNSTTSSTSPLGSTQPVGQKMPNAWGLHDMLGNVSELVQDWAGEYPGGAVTDPAGPLSGSHRLHRGCGWASFDFWCRSPKRLSVWPVTPSPNHGFRLLRTE